MRLVLEDVDAGFPGRIILRGLSLVFDEGIHVVLGANGSGKTTLLRTAAGLLKPLRGTVRLGGRDVSEYSRRELAKLIGYCWQNPYYGFFEETVEREIGFILENTRVPGRKDIIDDLGIRDLLHRSPFTLSGGEAKRVSLASVLIADQPVMLLDEPFEGLDYSSVTRLLELLWGERSRGKTIVVATHNVLLASKLKPEDYVVLRGERASTFGPSSLSDEVLADADIIPRGWWYE
jgi:energy-coupling factor transport system ATP-binding protein